MVKSWRERVADAEAPLVRVFGLKLGRRGFRLADLEAWKLVGQCCVGEQAHAVAAALDISFISAWDLINLDADGGEGFSRRALDAIVNNKPQQLARVLDAIEDRALTLKREGVV
jgi:hypothetical protein